MRIVEQARLGFREGKSDKVYEVDLVEVAADQYVVNFRYGRRGTALRDGTKTPLPLSLEKARGVFTALVAEKTRGGYTPIGSDDVSDRAPRVLSAADLAARDARTAQELLAALGRGHRGKSPLHLVVRKVGERGLSEAEPFLLELLGSGSPESGLKPQVLLHFVIGALARCGSARSLGPLRVVAENTKSPRHLRDIARLAMAMIGGEAERARLWASLPAALQPSLGSDVGAQIQAAEQLLATNPGQARAAVFALYAGGPASSNEGSADEVGKAARRIVLSIARVARLQKEELGLLRALNWAAEIRRDGELFAIIARRFESKNARGRDPKNYFRRRAARALRRLGAIRSPDYVKMASELLLQYREGDAARPRHTGWGIWDAFGSYYALNFVLYGNSVRYERADHRRATWRCRSGYTPGQAAPNAREESYPALWDQAPELLWKLGVSASAGVVIQFAVRALREQLAFLAGVADAELASAMSAAQPPMRLLAFDVARQRPPNVVLARGALASEIDEAGAWVLSWVERTPELLLRELELFVALLTAKSSRVRERVSELTRGLVLEPDLARRLISASLATLLLLPDEPSADERARSTVAFLLERVSDGLEGLGSAVVRDLLSHPLSGVAELGAELVLRRSRKAALEDGLLDVLLNSRHAAVRSVGARILAETPPEVMKNEPELLEHFALSSNAELREGTRTLLAEVARLFPEVGRGVASRLIDALLTPLPEGAPAHVVALLRKELSACLPKRDAPGVLALINALSPHARQAGGLLVALLGPDDLELDTIIRLASHEILLVRQGAWALAQAAKERFRIAPVALARLCDARWDDSRAFAFGFVRSFAPIDLVPDGVIAICDSIEPEVQRFGQTLLLEYWRDEHAVRYLLRLSEHPSGNIQLLVSGLLERYARGNLEVLGQLLPCLTTVLSQVNRGAVAKQRVLEFLRTEAVASAEAAALVAPLLERQSLTRAVSHKAPLIATLVDLHERYPDVAVPISSPPIPFASRSNRAI